jgi:hypothetical protein
MATATLLLFILAGFALFTFYLGTHISQPSSETRLSQPTPLRPLQPESNSERNSSRQVADLNLSNQLRSAKARVAELEERAKIDQETIKGATEEKDRLLVDATTTNATVADLRRLEADQKERVAQLETALTQRDAALRDKDSELITERERIAALAKAQNVIAARNLHVVDVYDSDPDPKRRRAFGRILYTENKSLIFYAYDLTDPGQRTFHVWGQKLGDAKTIRSLGIFASDDIPDKRWRLTLDDPGVLAQVNSIFVTVEVGTRAGPQPRGERVLYAYLGSEANHP